MSGRGLIIRRVSDRADHTSWRPSQICHIAARATPIHTCRIDTCPIPHRPLLPIRRRIS